MIEVRAPKATKTLCGSCISAVLGKTSIDNPLSDSVFRHLFRIVQAMQATLPGSSVAEQVTVNHLVVGSIPTRAASSNKEMCDLWKSQISQLGQSLGTFEPESPHPAHHCPFEGVLQET